MQIFYASLGAEILWIGRTNTTTEAGNFSSKSGAKLIYTE